MRKSTSVSVGRHFDSFIRRQVSSGRFGTASEVIRAGLRMLEEEEARMVALRQAIDEGESSALVEDFDMQEIIAEAKGARRR